VLTQADVGKSITVTASYTDGQGNEESVSSAATNPVIGFNNEPTGTVTILGEATVDGELTAINNLADTDELGPISYQWYADGIAISGSTSALYKPVLGDKGKALTVVAFYTDGQGNAESVSSDPTDPVNNDGDLIQGTAGPDSLSGGDRDDTILGLEGRDTLRGQGGDDTLQGDEDIDTVVYDGALYGAEGISNYTLVRDGEQIAVTGPAADGNDLLIDVERVQFSDLSVAFDIDGHAGQVAKLLGAVIGKEDWYNPEFVGIGLNILDQPEFSFEILMEAALDVVLGLDRSNADVVNMLFNNLIGEAPSQTDLNNLVDPMDRGEFTQVELCILAAEHPINQLNIGLAELVETGLGYIPLA
jgi:Ca2+-binding RTX toxin-like protein